jgi:hypothetical protein
MNYHSSLLCFFTNCKYRQDEGECSFKGTLIISTEGDCQCMERKRSETTCTVNQKLGKEF